MAVTYMIICVFDFVLAPTGLTVLQYIQMPAGENDYSQWNPLTLTNGGLFHVAMGAVLGIAAWTKGLENLKDQASPASTTDEGKTKNG